MWSTLLSIVKMFLPLCTSGFYSVFISKGHTGQRGWRRWRQKRAKLHSSVPTRHGPSPNPFRSRVSWSSRPNQLHAGHWLAGGHHRAGVGLPESRGPAYCTATGPEDPGGTGNGDDHNPGGTMFTFFKDFYVIVIIIPVHQLGSYFDRFGHHSVSNYTFIFTKSHCWHLGMCQHCLK